MNLSMAIVEHWIRQYHPISAILSNEATISAVRLFTYEKAPNPKYLYVGRNRDFFENSQSDEVLLVHKKDVISLSTHELEDVFDSLQDAFAFYQNWEQEMLSAFQKENPEQVIIDSCKEIFGPMFFTTTSLQITAFSKQYPIGSVNQNWDDFWNLGTFSLSSLMNMQSGKSFEKFSQAWDCEVFYEESVTNYPYAMMISQENSAHRLIGQLTIISNAPFQQYHRDIAVYLKRALCLVANHEEIAERGSVVQSLLQDFLQGRRNDSASFHTFYQMQGWDPGQQCMVVLLKQKTGALITYEYHLKSLRKYFPNAIFYVHFTFDERQDGEIVCCVPVKPLEDHGRGNRFGLEMPDMLFEMARLLKLAYYCSYPFSGIENAAGQYRQAGTCLARGKPYYYDCALNDLADLNGAPEYRRLAVHPALERILDYDRRKNTSFYHILKTYLRCERNRVLTAQELFMHKNTLVYRIGKICALFSLDLEDEYEREYLLFSFRCMETIS